MKKPVPVLVVALLMLMWGLDDIRADRPAPD